MSLFTRLCHLTFFTVVFNICKQGVYVTLYVIDIPECTFYDSLVWEVSCAIIKPPMQTNTFKNTDNVSIKGMNKFKIIKSTRVYQTKLPPITHI